MITNYDLVRAGFKWKAPNESSMTDRFVKIIEKDWTEVWAHRFESPGQEPRYEFWVRRRVEVSTGLMENLCRYQDLGWRLDWTEILVSKVLGET